MSTGMPELGSKISLISKADIRYEGRLFTVDPQECTIALASVRSFGTEDRETQYPVAPQSQVYDYILFRGSDIKDIRVLNNVPSLPNDPAIMQMSVPPTLGAGSAPGQFTGQFAHPVVGQTPYQQYHPMGGFPASVHTQLNKTSSMLDLIGGGSQQNQSRSTTPAVGHRKSPTADQGTQVGTVPSASGQQRDSRRGSVGVGKQPPRNRTDSRNRQRYPSGDHHQNQQNQHQQQNHHQQQNQQHQGQHPAQQNHQNHQGPHQNHQGPHQNHQGPHQNQQGPHQNQHPGQMQPGGQQNYHHNNQHGQNYNRGGWRGRARGRGRGFIPRNKNTLKFENDYDFEQANTEFEELRTQLAKTKISDEVIKPEDIDILQDVPVPVGEVDKKDDSGNETGADVPEVDEDPYTGYDKTKSFFDNISCEAIERSKGRSQRTDWRTERKLNSETFGVASARRGNWRGRGNWRHNLHHQPMSYFPSWRGGMRGARGRPNNMNMNPNMQRINQPRTPVPQPQAQPPAAAAK